MAEKPILCNLEEIADSEDPHLLTAEVPQEYLWEGRSFLDLAQYMTNEELYAGLEPKERQKFREQATHLKGSIDRVLGLDNTDSTIMFWNMNDDPDVNKGPFNYNEIIGDYSADLIKVKTIDVDGEKVPFKCMDLQIAYETGGAFSRSLEYATETGPGHI